MTVSVGIVVWCNGGCRYRCRRMFESSGDTGEAARWQARQVGWTERLGLDYCPAHSDAGLAILDSDQQCEHGTAVTELADSAFAYAPPVRTYADGCQRYGPYS